MYNQMISELTEIVRKYNPEFIFTRFFDIYDNCDDDEQRANALWSCVCDPSPDREFLYEREHNGVEFVVNCTELRQFHHHQLKFMRENAYVVTVFDDLFENARRGNYDFSVIFYDRNQALDCVKEVARFVAKTIRKLDYSAL